MKEVFDGEVVDAGAGGSAPLRVVLELWPAEPRAKATITEGGKTRDYELRSSPVLSIILSYLKSLRK